MARFAARLTAEIRRLADYLGTIPHGGTVDYRQLSAVVGSDIQASRYRLDRARDLVLNESGIGFDTVPKIGLRRFVVEDIPNVGAASRKRCRLTARRGHHVMKAAIASFNDVPPEVQRRYWHEDAMLRIVQVMTADRHMRNLVETRDKPLPVTEVTRAMLTLIGAR